MIAARVFLIVLGALLAPVMAVLFVAYLVSLAASAVLEFGWKLADAVKERWL